MTATPPSLLLITYFFPPYNPTEHRHAAAIALAAVRSGWDVDVIAPWARNTHSDGLDLQWAAAFQGPGRLRVHRTPDVLVAKRRFPDGFLPWLPFVMARAIRIARRTRPCAILTSSFPYSAHLAGLAMHGLFRRPWIADTRDGWALDEQEQFAAIEPSARRRRWHRLLMGAVVRRVRQYWSLTPDIRDTARRCFPREPEAKFVTVMQGYKDLPFPSGGRPAEPGPLVLGYAGNFRPGVTPAEPFAAALGRLKERNPAAYGRIRVCVWGYRLPIYHRQLTELLDRAGVADRFELRPSVPEDSLVYRLHECDALLLSNGPSDWSRKRLSSKLFTYFSARRPILAVCEPDSAIARTVSATRTGTVISSTDPVGLSALLENWAEFRGRGDPLPFLPDPDALLPYSQEHGVLPLIARQLDELRGVA